MGAATVRRSTPNTRGQNSTRQRKEEQQRQQHATETVAQLQQTTVAMQ
jgi:hypothetical protein